jgi:multiple sugar transport system substrate-binding protein
MKGLGNGSNLQDIGISLVIRICSDSVPLSLMLLVASTVIIPAVTTAQPSFAQVVPQKEKVTLTAIFVELDTNRQLGKLLLERALAKLKPMYPNLDIQLNYLEYPSNQIRSQILNALNYTTNTSAATDLISFDQIWLGDFAQKGLLTDLTNYTELGQRK